MKALRLAAGPDTLVFLPGFMTAPQAYRVLLEPVARAGFSVVVPQLYRRGLAALAGRVSVQQEAQSAAALVRSLPGRVFLGGHSRGGQAAWRAAGLVPVAALCVVDPVDGGGRASQAATTTNRPAMFSCPTLIVGAGVGGICAPEPVNYRHFASAAPFARLEIVEEMGHADMLCGRSRAVGRRLCGGGADPDAVRRRCSELLLAALYAAMDGDW